MSYFLAVLGPVFIGKLWPFLKSLFIVARRKELLEVILPILVDIVRQVDADPTLKDSAERFQKVLFNALALIAAKQLEVASSLIWVAIGLAVQTFLDEQPTPQGRVRGEYRWQLKAA